MKKLEITFLDINNDTHIIRWILTDSSLCNRWILLHKKNQLNTNSYINTFFMNDIGNDLQQIRNQLTECITNINNVYDEPLPIYANIKKLNVEELNNLHERFERYGKRIDELMLYKTHWSESMHNNFLKLNELIHTHEDLNLRSTEEFPSMSLLYDYYPQGLHEDILEIDKIWLTTEFDWGGIYLGYNTLGKDWLKVCVDNDIDVIERGQVKSQKRFATETWVNFGPRSGIWERKKLEKWYLSLPENVQHKVPIENLNDLTFGRFQLGQIIINQYFLNYNSDLAQWYLPNSNAKRDWNNNVFSTFKSIKDIRFIEEI